MGIKIGGVSFTSLCLAPVGLTNLIIILAGWGRIVHS